MCIRDSLRQRLEDARVLAAAFNTAYDVHGGLLGLHRAGLLRFTYNRAGHERRGHVPETVLAWVLAAIPLLDRQMKDNVDMRAGIGEVGSDWFDTTLKVGNKRKTTRLGIYTKGETFEMMFDMSAGEW